MSVIINGQAANVTTPLTAVISSAVAGGGITTCTTTSPHLFGNQDSIVVTGATGMTGLNAAWTITVTGSSTFTIPSALSGTYGASSATATDYSLTPQFQWPSDGDAASAQLSGLISGATMLASYAQYLQNQVVTLQSVQPGLQCYVHSLLPSNSSTWSQSGNWTSSYANNVTGANGPVPLQEIVGVGVGDIIEVQLSANLYLEISDGTTAITRLSQRMEYQGPSTGGVTTPIAGSDMFQQVNLASDGVNVYTLTSISTAFIAPITGTYILYLNGEYTGGGGDTGVYYNIAGGSMVTRLWRTSGLL